MSGARDLDTRTRLKTDKLTIIAGTNARVVLCQRNDCRCMRRDTQNNVIAKTENFVIPRYDAVSRQNEIFPTDAFSA